ncbi:MAG: GNAT family N-acetyltransferase [Nitriliruptoraceae bacterium]
MDLTLRAITEEEVEPFLRTFWAVFGGAPDDRDLARARRRLEPERCFVAVELGGEVVATAGAHSFTMALPGGGEVGAAGVTLVAVRADHRRRGVLTALLRRLLDQARERGEAVAALWASETPIYGRFGFGPAIPTVELTLDRTHAALTVHGPVDEVELVDTAAARAAFPVLRDEVLGERAGLLRRPAAFWDDLLDPEAAPPRGAGPLQLALLPGRGYAIYRLEPEWTAGAPTGTVRVQELHATDTPAAAALWRFVTDVDLASTTVAGRRPVDDPVLAMVLDQGRARVAVDWPLQVRLLDPVQVLTTRHYAADDTLHLDVADAFFPDRSGRFELAVEGGRASCVRTEGAADLELDVGALSTVCLGGVRATQLVAAGQVVERVPGAASRLDRLLATPLAPWHEFMF